jgi:hypothetical protein
MNSRRRDDVFGVMLCLSFFVVSCVLFVGLVFGMLWLDARLEQEAYQQHVEYMDDLWGPTSDQ